MIIMKRFILAVFGCALASMASAQITTNIPLTRIESLESHTQTILIKGFAPVGSMTVEGDVISVRIKATSEVNTGHKLQAAVVEIAGKQEIDRIVIDYDEIDSLLNGIDFMSKADYGLSPLPGFDATYTTRAGLRVAAYTSRRSETIQPYIQSNTSGRLDLTANQLAELRSLIQQAKTNLDSLESK